MCIEGAGGRMLSPVELGIVGLIVVLLFGTKKLPELGAGLGKAISNFKRSYKEGSEIDVTPGANPPERKTGDGGQAS
jgi:sec-independent protein translocase protein TatA